MAPSTRTLLPLLAALGAAPLAQATDFSGWATQSIYQVMTDRFARTDNSTSHTCDLLQYCGGTWQGIINKLDYIQGMGFTAIQISPVVENIAQDTGFGEAYHGYWPTNLYRLNPNFGDADSLMALSDALHARNMSLMVDVVINDMAQAINGTMADPDITIDYSQFYPFDDESYYHKYCNITDWGSESEYQDCWLGVSQVALPDLDTESDAVVKGINTWIEQLVANYSIDGLRIDAAKHVNEGFLTPFQDAAGVFALGEVYSGVVNDMCKYQNRDELVGMPNFPVYFTTVQAFTAGNMQGLVDMIGYVKDACNDTSLLGSFTENHDLARFASYTDDIQLAANNLAFTLLADGIPTVYQGQEQHQNGTAPPDNRQPLWPTEYDTTSHLYNLTATLNSLRNHAISIDSRYAFNHSEILYSDNSTLASRKGPDGVQIVGVFSNQGAAGGKYELVVPGAFTEGTKVVDVLDCSTTLTAAAGGNITVSMDAGVPHAFFDVTQMKGSGLCGYTEDASTGTGSTTSTATGSAASSTTTKKGGAGRVALSLSTVLGALGLVTAMLL